jgi:hypothetical protein
MSRWTDQFENHAFRKPWETFKSNIEETTLDDDSVATSVAELARLKKITVYLDELIQSIDPELVPMNTWDSFNSQLSNCQQQLNDYTSNRNIGHIQKCNNHADNLLSYIRPYMVPAKSALTAIKRGAAEYAKTAEKYVKDFEQSANEYLDNILDLNVKSEKLHEAISDNATKVETLEEKLFGSEEASGLEDKIDGFAETIEAQNDKINELFNELLVGTTDEISTKKQILAAKEEIDQHKDQIETALAEIEEEIEEFERFHTKVFGKADEETAKRSGGIDSALETLKKNLVDFESAQKLKYKALNEEIESLLPGATNAGLATAYKDMKVSFDNPIKYASILFYISIGVLIIASLVLATTEIRWSGIKFIEIKDWTTVMKSFAYKIPFYGPIIWLAYFATKRRSEAQRLQQEYAHKEALARSYNNYKKQILELDEKDTEMRKDLIRKVVEAISHNASATLDGKHGDNMPSQDALDFLSKNASKFKG